MRSKYQIWYDQIVLTAQQRQIPRCYSELHHIKPRSLGGSDDISNLVRLTYREHFLVHWLLTKIAIGADLRKMQRALLAMTLKGTGERITAGWQFEAAKRAVRDLELDPIAEAQFAARVREMNAINKARQEAEFYDWRRIEKPRLRQANRETIAVIVSQQKLSKKELVGLASAYLSVGHLRPKPNLPTPAVGRAAPHKVASAEELKLLREERRSAKKRRQASHQTAATKPS